MSNSETRIIMFDIADVEFKVHAYSNDRSRRERLEHYAKAISRTVDKLNDLG